MNESAVSNKRATLTAFGLLVKRLRLARDLTQEELAERASVSARLISDLERGSFHRPRRDTVQLLADGLGLSGPDRDSFVALARGRPRMEADASAPPSDVPRYRLPVPPNPIVGREKEVAAATALLLQRDVRLLTLTGPGGVGKTRLALEVAAKTTVAFPDGTVFVDLAPLHDPALVLPTISQALGVRGDPEKPLRDALIEWMQEKRLLLVLDNFEHLTPAVTAVADLLASCAELKVLATSRALLRIRAERQYDVAPLALPDVHQVPPIAELATIPAVNLFVDRAEAADREFALTIENARAIAEIAVRLDGLPLAIELAAARIRVLSPASLLARLERRLPLLTGGALDLPARQQAMRATIDWSYDLLDPDERLLFRRLAVFDGGCTLNAAEAVSLDESNLSPAILDGLTTLIDLSLLRATTGSGIAEPRYSMLETIREYGLESLAAAGEEADIRARHAAWFTRLAERAAPELTGADQDRWFARLEAEHDNVRAGLRWSIAQRDAETALRLCGSLYRFWATTSHFDEAARWYDQVLAIGAGLKTTPMANSLLGAGVVAYFKGDYRRAETLWQESRTLFELLGDTTGVAYSFGNLGLVADAQGDYRTAVEQYQNALALFRELNDQTYIGYMLHNIGLIAHFEGDYERAKRFFEESLALCRALEDRNGIAMTLGNLALVAIVQGDFERALALQTESLTLRRDVTNKSWQVKSLENFAIIAGATGAPERAACLFGAAAALRAELGVAMPPNDQEFNDRRIAETRAQLSAEEFSAAWSAGEAMSIEEAITYALGPDRALFATGPRPAQSRA